MPYVEFRRNQIFHRLPEALCQQLFDTGETTAVPASTTIVHEGEALDHLFVLLSGRAEAILPAGENRVSTVRLAKLGEGDCFGEYAFIDKHPASATIRTLEDSDVFSISHEHLGRFLDSHPIVGSIVYQNLLGMLVSRLRASNAELDLFTLFS